MDAQYKDFLQRHRLLNRGHIAPGTEVRFRLYNNLDGPWYPAIVIEALPNRQNNSISIQLLDIDNVDSATWHMVRNTNYMGRKMNVNAACLTLEVEESAFVIERENRIFENELKNIKENDKMANKITLKGLDDKTVVHCKTEEQAKKVTSLAQRAGLTWISGDGYETALKWDIRKEKSCYYLTAGLLHSTDYFISKDFKILDADEFLRLNAVSDRPAIPNVELTPEEYAFDLNRLAAETDAVVKKQLGNGLMNFVEESNSVALEILGELKDKAAGIARNTASEFDTTLASILANTKELLLEELRKGRTIINVTDGASTRQISVSTDDHYMMEEVLESILLHKKTMLAGEAGTGKTYMGASIAKKLDLPFYKYSCSRDSSVHDLMGYKQPRSETYLTTTFLKAYEEGGVFLVDEYDAMPGDVALFFNGVADSSSSITIPHRDTNPIAKKHKDFYLIMCGNTWGKGSQDYSGRDFQDKALLDRFRMCRHHIGYDAKLEKTMVGEILYPFVVELRAKMTELGSYLSTRNVEDIGNIIRSGKDLNYIMKTIAEDMEETDKHEIARYNLATKYRNSYDSFLNEQRSIQVKREIEAKKAEQAARAARPSVEADND